MKISLCMSICIHAVSYSHYKQADITCTSREEQATRRQILTERKKMTARTSIQLVCYVHMHDVIV